MHNDIQDNITLVVGLITIETTERLDADRNSVINNECKRYLLI